MAIDYSVPLITDVKCAKLLIESLSRVVEPKYKKCFFKQNIWELRPFF